MIWSFSSSYLAPPIPWMKRSARTRRAKRVVVRARLRNLKPRPSRSRHRAAVASRALKAAPGAGETLAQERRSLDLAQGLLPELRQKGRKPPGLEHGRRPFGQAAK